MTPVGLIALGLLLVIFSEPIRKLDAFFKPRGLSLSRFQIIFVGAVFTAIGFLALPYFPEISRQPASQATVSAQVPARVSSQIAASQGPVEWQVQIIQDNHVLTERQGEVQLKRDLFTIRVILPAPIEVELNVFDRDNNFRLINPGYVFPDMGQCATVLCPLTGIAEDELNTSQSLLVDGQGTHFLYYNDGKHHRWSRISTTKDKVTFERDVARLNDQPVTQFAGKKLYLLFFVDYQDHGVVNENDLKKISLSFK